MAWIESHQGTERHPKTMMLAGLMAWDLDTTIGKLHRFWWWCLDFAPDGNVSRHSADTYAVALGLPADQGERLIKALFESRYLDITKDGQYLIHDWLEYAGRYLRDTKYRRNQEKYHEIQSLYSRIVSRQSADKSPKKRRKSAVPDLTLPTLPTLPTVASKLATLLASCIVINDPHNRQLQNGSREKTIVSWTNEIDKMMRLDGSNRTDQEITERLVWAQKDSFWHKVVLSAKSLRNNFDRIGLDMKKPNRSMADKHAGIDQWLKETFTEVHHCDA